MDWTALSLNHKPILDGVFKRHPMILSDYTFTNLWIWNDLRHYEIAFIDDFLCIRLTEEGRQAFLYPLGNGSRKPIIQKLASFSMKPFFLRAIPEEAIEELQDSSWSLEPEPDRFDYIYLFQDLLQLPGNAYQAKRNFIHQFEGLHDFEYLKIIPDHIPALIALEQEWFEEHPTPSRTMVHEHDAALKALRDFVHLGIFGGALWVKGRPIAYTLAEYMSCKVLLIHLEKALKPYKGAYPQMNQQLLRHLCSVEFVNREEDLGSINLAKAKQSYHPIFLAKKFLLSITLLP